MDKELIIKTVEREKWYPMVKPTNFEMQAAYTFNAFLDSLKDLDESELMSVMRLYKQAMTNVALALNEKL